MRSLVGCSPWGRYESDTTKRLHFPFSHSRIWEGNGDPLQCSCLENPRDGGAWWAAVYGVAQSWTRLKRLSSTCSRCVYRGGETSLGKRGVRGRRLIRQQKPPPRTVLRRQKVWPFRGRKWFHPKPKSSYIKESVMETKHCVKDMEELGVHGMFHLAKSRASKREGNGNPL